MANEIPQWVKHRDKDEWSLHAFPYELIITHKPKEELPYVGSLRCPGLVFRDLRAWATAEEANVGIIQWALEKTVEGYNMLLTMLPPEMRPQQTSQGG